MKLWFLLFLVLPVAGLAYIIWHAWQILPWSVAGKIAVVMMIVLAAGCLFFNFTVGLDGLPLWLARFMYDVGTSSLIVTLYAVMLFLLLDLGMLCRIVPHSFMHGSIMGSVSVAVVLAGLFVYGNINYRHKERRELELRAAQPLSSPLRVVMMSDMHLGYHNTRADLAQWIDLINSESPDAVLICGDIIDNSVRPLVMEDMAAEFRRLEVPVYACPGNHEYYSGFAAAMEFFNNAGIKMLRDTSAVIGGEVTIIGRDDRSNKGRKSVAALVAAAPQTKYTILLDHQPYHLDRAEKAGIDLQFSGHTHYGQVWPVNWIEDAIYENAYGLLTKGNTRFYVSSGMGIWGGKFRIGTRSEYVVATLQ